METLDLLVSTHPAFRELSDYVKAEHKKRQPAIDAKMNPLRMKAWETWNSLLDADDPRRNKIPPKLLEGAGLTI